MMNRVELNEEMMAQVNGGKPTTSAVNPYSTNAPQSYGQENKDAEYR